MTTYIELKKKAEDLFRQAEAARRVEIGAAISEIKATMAAYGISVEDLGKRKRTAKERKSKAGAAKPDRKRAKARKPVAVKYRNAETGETWTGRGKPPRWLAALEAGGRKREEFVVG